MRIAHNTKKSEKDQLPNLLLDRGIRPTKQRVALAAILFDGKHKHFTAEHVLGVARKKKVKVSLATIYNSLHQFTKAGMLRSVTIDQNRSYFDTNIGAHHHFFDEITGQLNDVPHELVQMASLPKPPVGRKIERVDVIIRLSDAA